MDKDTPARVLVIDDDSANIELLEALLTPQGYRVFKAQRGEEGIRMAKEVSPHVILLDIMMPEMNGYQVCKRLKVMEETRLIPVIMLTSLNGLEDKVKGIEAGADDFICKPFHIPELLARVGSLRRLRDLFQELEKAQNVIFTLAITLEVNDPYTHGHSQRVSELSQNLAMSIGLSEKEAREIKDAALLHDIGKIGIDRVVLHKSDTLSRDEYEHIKQHPVIGERICSPLGFAKPLLPMIRHHHERLDGSGYPDGLQGDNIPLGARLIGIVDIYDALTSLRPYRSGMTRDEALEAMKVEARKGCWDIELLSAFIRMLKGGDKAGVRGQ